MSDQQLKDYLGKPVDLTAWREAKEREREARQRASEAFALEEAIRRRQDQRRATVMIWMMVATIASMLIAVATLIWK